jgi:succinoglycan biosynthesis transport protein ExoP
LARRTYVIEAKPQLGFIQPAVFPEGIKMQEISPYFIERTGESPRSSSPEPGHYGNQRVDLRDYWRILCKYRRLILGTTAAASVLCTIYLIATPSLYTATATLYLEPQARDIYAVNGREADAPNQDSAEHDYYRTQYEIMASPGLAARVIRRLNLEKGLSSGPSPHGLIAGWLSSAGKTIGKLDGSLGNMLGRTDRPPAIQAGETDPRVIGAYLARLAIRPKYGTALVRIEFTSPDPVLSARIVNAHIDEYIRRSVTLNSEARKAAQEFMQAKLVELRQRVEKSEAALNQYRRDRGIVAFSLNDGGQTLVQRLKDLNSELTAAEEKRIDLEALHQLVVRRDYEALPEVLNSQLIQQLKRSNAELAAQYASLNNRFNPGYHPLDDLKVRLDESEHRLATEMGSVAGEVEAEYRAAVSDEEKLKDQVNQVRAQAVKLNDASLQDAILARDVDTNRQLYQSILRRMNEVAISADVPVSNVSVVDRARPPLSRSSPKVFESFIFVSTLGLLLGCGLAFVIDSADDSLASPREVEDFLRLPTLAAVPEFGRLAAGGRSTSRYLRPRQTNDKVPIPGGNSVELLAKTRSNPVGEAYRTARTALMFSRAGSPPKSILVTSSVMGEGKTVSSVNLGLAYAQLGGKTVVVDADLRRPRCHRVFRLTNGAGLSDLLAGQADLPQVIQDTTLPGLSLVSAGTNVPNPAELLGSDEMRRLIAELGQLFAYVVIDSPPLMPVSDAIALSTMVDGVVVVVSTKIPKQMVRDSCLRLRHAGAHILGVMLNKVDVTGPDYHYHHRYSYSYAHHYYDSIDQQD